MACVSVCFGCKNVQIPIFSVDTNSGVKNTTLITFVFLSRWCTVANLVSKVGPRELGTHRKVLGNLGISINRAQVFHANISRCTNHFTCRDFLHSHCGSARL